MIELSVFWSYSYKLINKVKKGTYWRKHVKFLYISSYTKARNKITRYQQISKQFQWFFFCLNKWPWSVVKSIHYMEEADTAFFVFIIYLGLVI